MRPTGFELGWKARDQQIESYTNHFAMVYPFINRSCRYLNQVMGLFLQVCLLLAKLVIGEYNKIFILLNKLIQYKRDCP